MGKSGISNIISIERATMVFGIFEPSRRLEASKTSPEDKKGHNEKYSNTKTKTSYPLLETHICRKDLVTPLLKDTNKNEIVIARHSSTNTLNKYMQDSSETLYGSQRASSNGALTR